MFLSLSAPAGSLPSLQALDLAGNALSGNIPTSLLSMAALEELDLSSNELSGTLPTDWSGAGSLVLLYLQQNELTGTPCCPFLPPALQRCDALASRTDAIRLAPIACREPFAAAAAAAAHATLWCTLTRCAALCPPLLQPHNEQGIARP